jgi:hypothetical protein
MEKLIIFRMFLCFPLFGSILPDIGIWLSSRTETIPLLHLIIETTLLISVAICSVRIYILKKKKDESAVIEND